MHSVPTVSVMMPVWMPHPVYFREAVRSILRQTLTNWELVVVEAPSDQSAAAILAEFADPRIRCIVNPQRTSLKGQRNQCIQEARGELIACHDADDVSEPTRFAQQVEFLQQHPEIAVVGSQLTIINEEGVPFGRRSYPGEHEQIVRTMRRSNAIAQPSAMFRKSEVSRFGCYQLDGTCEDYDLWSRMLIGGACFANLPDALLQYRIHGEASKKAQLKLTIRNTLAVKRAHWLPTMTWGDRLRMLLERLLLVMPSSLVLALFKRTQYQKLATR